MPDTPPGIYEACKSQSEAQGFPLCPQDHCNANNVKVYTHDYCYCQGRYAIYKVGDKCPFGNDTPVPVLGQDCNCCCGCFASGTPIAFDRDQYKAIETYVVGDKVWTADNLELTSWSQRTVLFSGGAGGANSDNLMLRVIFVYPDGKVDSLICSRDQIFVLATRQLATANKLIPGRDELLTFDNNKAH